MHDAGKIFPGLVILLVLITLPFWYNAAFGKGGMRPEIQRPEGYQQCVEATEYMRVAHMDLLNDWRDAVVRDGKRVYVSTSGVPYDMSLTMTCMKCHTDREQSCDRCHNYVSVTPYCWECHVDQKGATK